MKFVTSTILLITLLVSAAAMAQSDDIYTWTDSKGTVHISQTPHKGARKIGDKYSHQNEQPSKTDADRPISFLGSINDTKYFLDRKSIQIFANDRNKYKFNLYVNDRMYTCTAWAYPSGVIGIKPAVGLPDMVQRELRIELIGK